MRSAETGRAKLCARARCLQKPTSTGSLKVHDLAGTCTGQDQIPLSPPARRVLARPLAAGAPSASSSARACSSSRTDRCVASGNSAVSATSSHGRVGTRRASLLGSFARPCACPASAATNRSAASPPSASPSASSNFTAACFEARVGGSARPAPAGPGAPPSPSRSGCRARRGRQPKRPGRPRSRWNHLRRACRSRDHRATSAPPTVPRSLHASTTHCDRSRLVARPALRCPHPLRHALPCHALIRQRTSRPELGDMLAQTLAACKRRHTACSGRYL